jgi:hypothetical protein
MNHELICSWLGLPPGRWPPDHYRLLGLEPGENNAELIEQRVHQRLDSVRRYQMMHPEQATEAMNRLAQAFVCLMEPAAKKFYDATLLGLPAPVQEPAPPPVLQPETLDWLYNPPPVVAPANGSPNRANGVGPPPLPNASILNYSTSAPPPIRQPSPYAAPVGETKPGAVLEFANATPPPVRQPPPLPLLPLPLNEVEPSPPPPPIPPVVASAAAEPIDPVLEAAQSGAARKGIGTKRALYYRIARTRRLLRVWTNLGKFLNSPKRRLNRATEGPELVGLLAEIGALLKAFPPLLGEAGQPGYLVLALAQVDTVKVFQSFSAHQREALTRDWRAGIKLLLAHRDFLRQELRALRKRTPGQRLARACYAVLTDQPGTLLLLLALLAINVALWRTYAEALWDKLFRP